MNDQCWWHDAVSNDPVPRTLSWPSLWILWPGVPRVMTMPCCDREQGTSHNMGSSINDTYIGFYRWSTLFYLFTACTLKSVCSSWIKSWTAYIICIAERHHLWRFLVISMHTSHVTCYREHWPVINVISVTLLVTTPPVQSVQVPACGHSGGKSNEGALLSWCRMIPFLTLWGKIVCHKLHLWT